MPLLSKEARYHRAENITAATQRSSPIEFVTRHMKTFWMTNKHKSERGKSGFQSDYAVVKLHVIGQDHLC